MTSSRKIYINKYKRKRNGKTEIVKRHSRIIKKQRPHKKDVRKIKKSKGISIVPGKTSKEQREKKVEGNIGEQIIMKEIQDEVPDDYSVILNTHEGIDIFVKNGETLNIEVKTAREKIKEGKGTRTGRFWIKEEDYLHSDLFGFVIKEVDDNLKWNGKTKTFYVKSEEIQKYLKKNKRYREAESVKININDIKSLPKIKLDKYFKEKGFEKKSFF